ncbi:MAG: hypothetical protein MUE55_03915 [Thermoplasmata archaeon]|jgi:hypothetical protein|nr:hypothetical protein [Thermoplasmata archaeon]
MVPGKAWGAFSLVYVLAVAAACAALPILGFDWSISVAFAIVALMFYGYIVYKRYRVEVVPEGDILLFDDPDDLRILCDIYGLETTGKEGALRERLVSFARENSDRSFVWVSPRAVHLFGAAFELGVEETVEPSARARPTPPPARQEEDLPTLVSRLLSEDGLPTELGALTGGKARSIARLSAMKACPLCDSKLPKGAVACHECGADLEFYAVLGETAIGKRLISQKAVAERRKLRYPVPQLRDR